MGYIVDIYPNKAQFLCMEPIIIKVEFYNPNKEDRQFSIKSKVFRLIEQVEQQDLHVKLPSNETKILTLTLSPKDSDCEGFGVELFLYEGEALIEKVQTAFDVVSDWRKAPRYGFLSDFYSKDQGDTDDIKSLCKYHLNLVQFYDWMYRHDELVSPESEFKDLMGRTLNQDVVKEKVNACHEHGMKAMAYGAVYAASNEFYQNHKEWGLYTSSGDVYNFIDIFKIMNIAPDSPWHDHIIDQYKNAIGKVGFDGIHMDTYGFPKSGISKIGQSDRIEYLENHFPVLIKHTREKLEQVKDDIGLIFNNVGNWPVDTVADSSQDAIYIEVWQPYERYHHLVQIIEQAKLLGKGKPIILAAYLDPFSDRHRGKVQEAQYSALILTAALAANGSYHMLLGENQGILTQGYYANYARLDDAFARRMRDYYDFIVRYSSILFDRSMRCVSMTHTHGDNQEYLFENAPVSTYGEPGKVWVSFFEKAERKAVNFINLCGNESDIWNEGKKEPIPVKNMSVKIQVINSPKAVYCASPDGSPNGQPLGYTLYDSPRGKILHIKLPVLKVWTLMVVDF